MRVQVYLQEDAFVIVYILLVMELEQSVFSLKSMQLQNYTVKTVYRLRQDVSREVWGKTSLPDPP